MEDGTGFSHFAYRDYSAPLQRWLAPDPAWLLHPEISPYAYVGNNPTMRRDWLGLEWIWSSEYGWIWSEPQGVTIEAEGKKREPDQD